MRQRSLIRVPRDGGEGDFRKRGLKDVPIALQAREGTTTKERACTTIGEGGDGRER